jgi:2-dehydro-3-deoxyphosphogluconate aldolase/(4S)-4-hydroxy-2-oxoglutarate aldolase
VTIGKEIGASAPVRTLIPELMPAALLSCPIIPVLRAGRSADYDPVIAALLETGLTTVEVTLTTPGTLSALPELVRRWGSAVGVGSVTTVDHAMQVGDAGAGYVVTPVAKAEIVLAAAARGIPVFPGALTPTEVFTMWEAGATAVKIFPAVTVGPQYGSLLRGPFPDLQFIPSGGVDLDHIPGWLAAGAAAVSVGTPLIGDAFRGGSLEGLRERARRALDAVGQIGDRCRAG